LTRSKTTHGSTCFQLVRKNGGSSGSTGEGVCDAWGQAFRAADGLWGCGNHPFGHRGPLRPPQRQFGRFFLAVVLRSGRGPRGACPGSQCGGPGQRFLRGLLRAIEQRDDGVQVCGTQHGDGRHCGRHPRDCVPARADELLVHVGRRDRPLVRLGDGSAGPRAGV